jgi:hypothetical protein
MTRTLLFVRCIDVYCYYNVAGLTKRLVLPFRERFFGKMRRVSNHVLVTERDQVVNVVVFFNELLRVDLQIIVEQKKVG